MARITGTHCQQEEGEERRAHGIGREPALAAGRPFHQLSLILDLELRLGRLPMVVWMIIVMATTTQGRHPWALAKGSARCLMILEASTASIQVSSTLEGLFMPSLLGPFKVQCSKDSLNIILADVDFFAMVLDMVNKWEVEAFTMVPMGRRSVMQPCPFLLSARTDT